MVRFTELIKRGSDPYPSRSRESKRRNEEEGEPRPDVAPAIEAPAHRLPSESVRADDEEESQARRDEQPPAEFLEAPAPVEARDQATVEDQPEERSQEGAVRLADFLSQSPSESLTSAGSGAPTVPSADPQIIPPQNFGQKEFALSLADYDHAEVGSLYLSMVSYIQEQLERTASETPVDVRQGEQFVQKLLNDFRLCELMSFHVTQGDVSLNWLATNMVHVCVYALKLAQGLQHYQQPQLEVLGIAALLHDIGVGKIPESILNKSSALTPREFEVIKQHPQIGAQTLLNVSPEYNEIAGIILQEHERFGGQGYPRGLRGDDIHEFARMIGLVDVFDAMVSPRPHRKGYSPPHAVKYIIESQREHYDPRLLKRFVMEFSMFPLNSLVRLNTRAIGRVVKINSVFAMRPAVKIIYDSHGRKITDPQVIDLAESPLLYIIDNVDVDELPA